jgi:hypothetical protein
MINNVPLNDAAQYAAAILQLYLQLPETPLRASSNDRQTVDTLHARGIDLATIESALLLASVRRLSRSPDSPPLSPIRSLAYFLPVIDEILNNPVLDDYLEYLRRKVKSLSSRGGLTKSA